jgi:hypothetical protein
MKLLEHWHNFLRKEVIRGITRSSGHDKGTICKWIDLAGKHCEEMTDYFLRNLHLDRVQVDEIWSYIKKRKNIIRGDPEDCGELYTLTAIKKDARLFISHYKGERRTKDATELFRRRGEAMCSWFPIQAWSMPKFAEKERLDEPSKWFNVSYLATQRKL